MGTNIISDVGLNLIWLSTDAATQYTRQGALGTGELVCVEPWLMHGDLHFIALLP